MPFALPPLAHRRGLLLAVVGLGLGVMGFALFAGRVAALRSGHATGPNWKFPSLVYSDDVVLVPGRILPAEYLLAQLEARDYHEVPGHPLGPGTFARLGETFEIALRGFSRRQGVSQSFVNCRWGGALQECRANRSRIA